MEVSLCHRYPCPGICVRVCHCPAGLVRSHQLLGMLRNRREFSRPRPSRHFGLPPERWPEVEFIPQARHNSGILNQPEHKKPTRYLPTRHDEYAAPSFSRNLKWLTSRAILIGFVVLMSVVIAWGFIENGPNLVPHYDPNPVNYPPYEWMWENR